MSLLRCTLTGVDDSTPLDVMWELGREYPEVEWGVLFSDTQHGRGRFPSVHWMDQLTERLDSEPGPGFALHICGRAVGDFLAGNSERLRRITRDARYFQRIQLNLRADHYDPDTIRAAIHRQHGHTVITQHNEANAPLLAVLSGLKNHAVLFDASGGRGIRCTSWSVPIPGVQCGYAGGLGPDNLAEELPRIHQIAGDAAYWIDMEGSLRDKSDRFDVERARRCLATVRAFLIRNDLLHRTDEGY